MSALSSISGSRNASTIQRINAGAPSARRHAARPNERAFQHIRITKRINASTIQRGRHQTPAGKQPGRMKWNSINNSTSKRFNG